MADRAGRAALDGIVATHGRTTHIKRTLARAVTGSEFILDDRLLTR